MSFMRSLFNEFVNINAASAILTDFVQLKPAGDAQLVLYQDAARGAINGEGFGGAFFNQRPGRLSAITSAG
jgi:hypothetical protein